MAWVKVLTMVPTARRREILAVTDGSPVSGLCARGRSSRYNLNRLARQMWVAAAVCDFKLRVPWIDTYHQPSDGGTRLINGRLIVGPVRWAPRSSSLCFAIQFIYVKS